MNHKHHPAENNLDYERGVIDGMQKQMQSSVDKAVRKMSQPEPEAVAWRFDQAKYRENDLRGRQWVFNVFSQTKPYMDEMVRNVTPLYRDPTPCQTCEALARTVMMDQTSHDTAAPRKEWQGLTDEEILKTTRDHYSPHQRPEITFARAIEAKLKEKNT